MNLGQQWDALNAEKPLRTREAANRLGVSEFELLSTKIGTSVTLLNVNAATLMNEFNPLGHVMALTRNEACVHETKGTYGPVEGSDHVAMMHHDNIDLRMFDILIRIFRVGWPRISVPASPLPVLAVRPCSAGAR